MGWDNDPETSLYYYRARYYDPQAGQFLQVDPIGHGGGINRCVCGHIATRIVDEYGIKPSRMLFVEYTPEALYGKEPPKKIPAVLDIVEFDWKDRLALNPKRHPLEPTLRKRVLEIIEGGETESA